MGNIMLCGTLCESCDVTNNLEEKEKEKEKEREKFQLEHILIKEATNMEKMEKYISKEITILKNNIDNTFQNVKTIYENQDKIFAKELETFDKKLTKNIEKIEYIKEHSLPNIDNKVASLDTIMKNVIEDMKEFKLLMNKINDVVIQNSTKIEYLK